MDSLRQYHFRFSSISFDAAFPERRRYEEFLEEYFEEKDMKFQFPNRNNNRIRNRNRNRNRNPNRNLNRNHNLNRNRNSE